jgi:hypothetical protein
MARARPSGVGLDVPCHFTSRGREFVTFIVIFERVGMRADIADRMKLTKVGIAERPFRELRQDCTFVHFA